VQSIVNNSVKTVGENPEGEMLLKRIENLFASFFHNFPQLLFFKFSKKKKKKKKKKKNDRIR
jgi:hypothetical protein